jgi:phenylalanine-4-hydroxylase
MTWDILLERQTAAIENRACKEFLEGYQAFDGLLDSFPNIDELSNKLEKMTGWRAVPVSGLLEYNQYFQHLANKIFPVASFLRNIEHLDYIPEPDAWHDIFGHLPLLTNPIYSRFVATLSRQIVLADETQRQHLNNLYWYTIEVGLCQENGQSRAYGAALLSSFHEIQYALSDKPNIHLLDLGIVSKLTVKIDEIQNNLYEIPFFDFLEDLTEKIDKLIIPTLPSLQRC